jgi:hypothetical protein
VPKEHSSFYRVDSGGLLEALAGAIAALHDCCVTYGDLKWSNPVDEKVTRIWFVDQDSAKYHARFLGASEVARDLARFVLYGFQTETKNSVINRVIDAYCRHRNLARESLEDRMAKVLKKFVKRHRSIPEDRIKELLKNY